MTDLTTLAKLKAALDITSTADDAWLQAELSDLSNFAEAYVGRALTATTGHVDEFELPRYSALLRHFPVAAVSQYDIDGTAQAATLFRLRRSYGEVVPPIGKCGQITGGKLLTITYDSADPEEKPMIERAIIDMVRDRLRLKSSNILSGTVATGSGELKSEVVFDVAQRTYETTGDLIRAAASGSGGAGAAAALFGNWVGFFDSLKDWSRDVSRSDS